jgi:hypothetical protein
VGQCVAGPALIEERETTTLILPGWTARMDASGCLLVEHVAAAQPDDRQRAALTPVAAL